MAVLIPADYDPALTESLEEATQAQLVSLPVRLEFSAMEPVGVSIPDRLAQARAHARGHNTLLVSWFDSDARQQHVLYILDPAADQLVARVLDHGQDAPHATMEAMAVIIRSATEALLSGRPPPGSVAVRPPSEPRVQPPPATHAVPDDSPGAPAAAPLRPEDEASPTTSHSANVKAAVSHDARPPGLQIHTPFTVALGYRGQPVGDRLAWTHGMAIEATLALDNGFIIGAEYTWHPPAHLGTAAATLRLQRTPFGLLGAYQIPLGPVALRVGVAALVEIQVHETDTVTEDVTPAREGTVVRYALAPGLRVAVPAGARLGVFAAAELLLYHNRFRYVIEGEQATTLVMKLGPLSGRATAGAWLAF